jgi:hypothetical protein
MSRGVSGYEILTVEFDGKARTPRIVVVASADPDQISTPTINGENSVLQ